MPAKWEHSGTIIKICETKDKVPRIIRVEVLVCHTEDAECILCLILKQSFIDFFRLELKDAAVVSAWDIVGTEEVIGYFLYSCFPIGKSAHDQFATGVNYFNITSAEIGLTVRFEHLTRLNVYGLI